MRHPLVNVAVEAARKGGQVALRYLNRVDSAKITEKARYDFVSEADRASEKEIIHVLKRAHPEHGILGEESGADKGGKPEYRWIIDPLDGTANFLYGMPHFAVSIALEHEGRLEHAVVYDPLREELFTASRGKGSFLNNRRMRVNDRPVLKGGILATGFPFRSRQYLKPYMGMFEDLFTQVTDVRRAGSAALDLAYVAAGRLDGFWEIGLKAWDTAAGTLLIREAGGVVKDFSGGQDFLGTGNLVAGNMKVAEEIVRTIKPHLVDGIRK